MPSTFSALHVHLVFSTKNREPWIPRELEERVWEYLGAVAVQHGMKPIQIGGVEDHIHALIGVSPTLAVSRAAQLLKGASSHWLHQTFPDLAHFAWQDGYGAFSVSQSAIPGVVAYIRRQREHHEKQSYLDEFRALLRRHGIDPDEEAVE